MSTPSSSSSGKPKPAAPGPIVRPPARRRRRFPTCLVVALLLLLIVVLTVSYALTHIFTSSSSTLLGNGDTRSASAVASDFMDALKDQQYSSKAYLDLDGAVQALLTASDFDQQAKLADQCDGVVTEYTQIESTSQKAVKRFTYSVTRKKLARPYRFVLQLEQQQGGNWTITGYGGGATLLPPNAAQCS